MALATRCPDCGARFRVVADQLKLRGGLVRCGQCRTVFDAVGALTYLDREPTDTGAIARPAGPAAPVPGAPPAASPPDADSVDLNPPTLLFRDAAPVRPDPGERQLAPLSEAPVSQAPTHDAPATDTPATPAPATAAATAAAPPAMAEHATRPTRGTLARTGAATRPANPHTEADAAATDGLRAAGRGVADPSPADPWLSPATRPAPPDPATASDSADPPPAFLRDRRAGRLARWLWGTAAALLAVVLLGQAALAWHAELLARWPRLYPLAAAACAQAGCTPHWPMRPEQIAVVGSDLQAVPNTARLELNALLRNRASVPLEPPAIELTLTDAQNRVVLRRVFHRREIDYELPTTGEGSGAALPPGEDTSIRIHFEARGISPVSFVLYPFYP